MICIDRNRTCAHRFGRLAPVTRAVRFVSALAVCVGGVAPVGATAAGTDYESVAKKAVAVYDLQQILRPFVATCERRKTYFGRLFCEALNERLKAQHQNKVYRYVVKPSAQGPLVARFNAKPKPSVELQLRGCLTCKSPVLPRKGGDITKGRFFVFQLPRDVRVGRDVRAGRGRAAYDLGELTLASYTVALPDAIKNAKLFRQQVLPHLRAELLFRPVAGVTRIGKRFKYGFINFELAAHRAYHKCDGALYGAAPAMKAKRFNVDKNDLTCPQNNPKMMAKTPKLPARLPQAKVRALMESVSADLHTCYNQFGVKGDAPADIVVTPKGKVKVVKVAGKLSGTASARCVERLVKNVAFPPFEGDSARLQWPFAIRVR